MLKGKSFCEDEKSQGAIEYILLAGGMIVGAIIVYSIYVRMGRSTAEALNKSVTNASSTMEEEVMNEMAG